MFTIALKIVLVSALLLAVYYIFLEKEKVLKFNRFYLLFSLVFAYAVPFISLTIPNFEKSKPNLIIGNAVQQQAVFVSNAEQNNVDWMFLISIIYVSVALLFLVKAIISVCKILNLKGKTVLITGGSRGIGRAIALAFAGEGTNVIINYTSDEENAKNAELNNR